jgi:isocitrate dehydrogenase
VGYPETSVEATDRSCAGGRVGTALTGHTQSEFVVEVEYDHEVGLWFYSVDELNIIGTGCLTREDAERYARESIAYALEEESA